MHLVPTPHVVEHCPTAPRCCQLSLASYSRLILHVTPSIRQQLKARVTREPPLVATLLRNAYSLQPIRNAANCCIFSTIAFAHHHHAGMVECPFLAPLALAGTR